MEKREYWLWASTVENIYFDKLKQIVNLFGGIENLYNAGENEFIKKGIEKEWEAAFLKAKDRFDVDRYKQELNEKNIKIVTVEDKEYPEKLFHYNHKPYFLFYKGKLPDKDKPAVAMVGARNCSNYGRNIAKTIAGELSERGIQVISGMARGVDTYSHLGALTGESPTFAVLGCGVDICYPSENIELYNDILKNGGIISEYPIGAKSLPWHFPQRNRIISGLSDVVVVVEAKEKSGSLITVEWALEQGKDIMAVPGRISDVLSKGCNRLIRAGAEPVTDSADILNALNYDSRGYKSLDSDSKNAEFKDEKMQEVYNVLSFEPQSVKEIIENCKQSYEIVSEKLLQLQLLGMVEQPTEGYYYIAGVKFCSDNSV
jgi:DNA processing protein